MFDHAATNDQKQLKMCDQWLLAQGPAINYHDVTVYDFCLRLVLTAWKDRHLTHADWNVPAGASSIHTVDQSLCAGSQQSLGECALPVLNSLESIEMRYATYSIRR
jgi:hypothetical protein